MAPVESSGPINLLRRRNAIAAPVLLQPNLSLQTKFYRDDAAAIKSSSPSDFELSSIKPQSYTSLKDLLPSIAVLSPRPSPSGVSSGYEISIRNRLVKQAAWAYLQPMSSSPDSSSRNLLRRLWANLSGDYNPFTSFLRFVNQHIVRPVFRALDGLLRSVSVWKSR